MQPIFLASRRLLAVVLIPLTLLGAAGCSDDPFIGDDLRVVRDSPGYLHQAFIYANRDAASDAEANFHAGDYRLRALVSFGEHYPGCRPGVGEKYARRYGAVILPKTAGAIEIDAQETYRNIAWNYAATYNHEMLDLLGPVDAHPRGNGTAVVDK